MLLKIDLQLVRTSLEGIFIAATCKSYDHDIVHEIKRLPIFNYVDGSMGRVYMAEILKQEKKERSHIWVLPSAYCVGRLGYLVT